jgi:hypothetical protein
MPHETQAAAGRKYSRVEVERDLPALMRAAGTAPGGPPATGGTGIRSF